MKIPFIVTGNYGSGKTEFCLNYALYLRTITNEPIYIADLDVINPYFRSREKSVFLEKFGINIIGNSLQNNTGQDLPAISGNMVNQILNNQNLIVDLAGSENGLKALVFFKQYLKEYELLCVVNVFRPETSDVEKIIEYVTNLECFGKLKITALVNNSNMLHETTVEHIVYSMDMVEKVCEKINIPLKYTLIRKDLSFSDQIKNINKSKMIVFEKLQMRDIWQ